jgi:hypothetical protein
MLGHRNSLLASTRFCHLMSLQICKGTPLFRHKLDGVGFLHGCHLAR